MGPPAVEVGDGQHVAAEIVVFADLWQAVMGEAWTPASGATDPTARQRLRDELEELKKLLNH